MIRFLDGYYPGIISLLVSLQTKARGQQDSTSSPWVYVVGTWVFELLTNQRLENVP